MLLVDLQLDGSVPPKKPDTCVAPPFGSRGHCARKNQQVGFYLYDFDHGCNYCGDYVTQYQRHDSMNPDASPDSNAAGILGRYPDPLRYTHANASAAQEVPGIIRAWMPHNICVLDVGCGTGGHTLEINQGKNNAVVCVEPDPQRAAVAREKGLTVHTAFFDDRFAESCGTFDIIVFGDVLEHAADPGAMLTRARRCLNTRGSLVISVPNIAHWTVRSRLLIGRFDYEDGGIMDATHLRWFTRRTLLALMHNAGFAVDRVACSAGLWMPQYEVGVLRFVPRRILARVVLILLRLFPGLMACQYVVQSRVGGEPPNG
jgi:SAM-dependent methyltransferase